MTSEDARQHIGFPVVYRGLKKKYGTIKWVTSDDVFVLYDGDANPKATNPRDIEFSNGIRA